MKNWIIAACFFVYLNGCLFGAFHNPSAWYVPALWFNFWTVGAIGCVVLIYVGIKKVDNTYL